MVLESPWNRQDNPMQFAEPPEPVIFSKGLCGTRPHSWIHDIHGEDRVMQWVINNNSTSTHPLHIHGRRFQIVAVGGGDGGSRFDPSLHPRLPGGSTFAPMRDTFDMQPQGWVVLRMIVENPGMWMLHCHVGVHQALGMASILSVLPDQQVQPAGHLPRCGICYQQEDDIWSNSGGGGSFPTKAAVTSVVTGVVGIAVGILVARWYLGKYQYVSIP